MLEVTVHISKPFLILAEGWSGHFIWEKILRINLESSPRAAGWW